MLQMVRNKSLRRQCRLVPHFFLFAVFVGIQSFILQLIDQTIGKNLVWGGYNGFAFIAFQGWALYFLLGSSIKGAMKCFCGYIAGIIFAVIMMGMAAVFDGFKVLAVPAAALLIVPVMMYFEYAHAYINNVSIFFLGAGAFYGIQNYVQGIGVLQTAGIVILYCAMGLLCGWVSVSFRARLTAWAPKEEGSTDVKPQTEYKKMEGQQVHE